MSDETSRGTIRDGEFHPAASDALRYIKSIPVDELMLWRESYASNAIEGNRMGEICGETLDRIFNGAPVSDRYVLGLAWSLRGMRDALEDEKRKATTNVLTHKDLL